VIDQLSLGDRLVDRDRRVGHPCSKPSFAVCRNFKNAKYHFIEAKIDKLTQSSDITDSDTTQVSCAT